MSEVRWLAVILTYLVITSSQEIPEYGDFARQRPDLNQYANYERYDPQDLYNLGLESNSNEFSSEETFRRQNVASSYEDASSSNDNNLQNVVTYTKVGKARNGPTVKITYKKRYRNKHPVPLVDQSQYAADYFSRREDRLTTRLLEDLQNASNEKLTQQELDLSELVKNLCGNPKEVFLTIWNLVARLLHLKSSHLSYTEKLDIFLDVLKKLNETERPNNAVSAQSPVYQNLHKNVVPIVHLLRSEEPDKDKVNEHMERIVSSNLKLHPTLKSVLRSVLFEKLNDSNKPDDLYWHKLLNELDKVPVYDANKYDEHESNIPGKSEKDLNSEREQDLTVKNEEMFPMYHEDGESVNNVPEPQEFNSNIFRDRKHNLNLPPDMAHRSSEKVNAFEIEPELEQPKSKNILNSEPKTPTEFLPDTTYPYESSSPDDDNSIYQKRLVYALLRVLKDESPDISKFNVVLETVLNNNIKLNPDLLALLSREFNKRLENLGEDTEDVDWNTAHRQLEKIKNRSFAPLRESQDGVNILKTVPKRNKWDKTNSESNREDNFQIVPPNNDYLSSLEFNEEYTPDIKLEFQNDSPTKNSQPLNPPLPFNTQEYETTEFPQAVTSKKSEFENLETSHLAESIPNNNEFTIITEKNGFPKRKPYSFDQEVFFEPDKPKQHNVQDKSYTVLETESSDLNPTEENSDKVNSEKKPQKYCALLLELLCNDKAPDKDVIKGILTTMIENVVRPESHVLQLIKYELNKKLQESNDSSWLEVINLFNELESLSKNDESVEREFNPVFLEKTKFKLPGLHEKEIYLPNGKKESQNENPVYSYQVGYPNVVASVTEKSLPNFNPVNNGEYGSFLINHFDNQKPKQNGNNLNPNLLTLVEPKQPLHDLEPNANGVVTNFEFDNFVPDQFKPDINKNKEQKFLVGQLVDNQEPQQYLPKSGFQFFKSEPSQENSDTFNLGLKRLDSYQGPKLTHVPGLQFGVPKSTQYEFVSSQNDESEGDLEAHQSDRSLPIRSDADVLYNNYKPKQPDQEASSSEERKSLRKNSKEEPDSDQESSESTHVPENEFIEQIPLNSNLPKNQELKTRVPENAEILESRERDSDVSRDFLNKNNLLVLPLVEVNSNNEKQTQNGTNMNLALKGSLPTDDNKIDSEELDAVLSTNSPFVTSDNNFGESGPESSNHDKDKAPVSLDSNEDSNVPSVYNETSIDFELKPSKSIRNKPQLNSNHNVSLKNDLLPSNSFVHENPVNEEKPLQNETKNGFITPKPVEDQSESIQLYSSEFNVLPKPMKLNMKHKPDRKPSGFDQDNESGPNPNAIELDEYKDRSGEPDVSHNKVKIDEPELDLKPDYFKELNTVLKNVPYTNLHLLTNHNGQYESKQDESYEWNIPFKPVQTHTSLDLKILEPEKPELRQNQENPKNNVEELDIETSLPHNAEPNSFQDRSYEWNIPFKPVQTHTNLDLRVLEPREPEFYSNQENPRDLSNLVKKKDATVIPENSPSFTISNNYQATKVSEPSIEDSDSEEVLVQLPQENLGKPNVLVKQNKIDVDTQHTPLKPIVRTTNLGQGNKERLNTPLKDTQSEKISHYKLQNVPYYDDLFIDAPHSDENLKPDGYATSHNQDKNKRNSEENLETNGYDNQANNKPRSGENLKPDGYATYNFQGNNNKPSNENLKPDYVMNHNQGNNNKPDSNENLRPDSINPYHYQDNKQPSDHTLKPGGYDAYPYQVKNIPNSDENLTPDSFTTYHYQDNNKPNSDENLQRDSYITYQYQVKNEPSSDENLNPDDYIAYHYQINNKPLSNENLQTYGYSVHQYQINTDDTRPDSLYINHYQIPDIRGPSISPEKEFPNYYKTHILPVQLHSGIVMPYNSYTSYTNVNYQTQSRYVLYLLQLLKAKKPNGKKINEMLDRIITEQVEIEPSLLLLLENVLYEKAKELDAAEAIRAFEKIKNLSKSEHSQYVYNGYQPYQQEDFYYKTKLNGLQDSEANNLYSKEQLNPNGYLGYNFLMPINSGEGTHGTETVKPLHPAPGFQQEYVLPDFSVFINSILQSSPSLTQDSIQETQVGKPNSILLNLRNLYTFLKEPVPNLDRITKILELLKMYHVNVSPKYFLRYNIPPESNIRKLFATVPYNNNLLLEELQKYYVTAELSDKRNINEIMLIINNNQGDLILDTKLKSLYEYLKHLNENQEITVNWETVLNDLRYTLFWSQMAYNNQPYEYKNFKSDKPNCNSRTSNGPQEQVNPTIHVRQESETLPKQQFDYLLLKLLKGESPNQGEIIDVLNELKNVNVKISPPLVQFLLRRSG